VAEDGGGQTLLRMSGWRGMSIELVAELDNAAGRLLLYLDWWAQLTATSLRLVTPVVHPLASTAPLGAACPAHSQ